MGVRVGIVKKKTEYVFLLLLVCLMLASCGSSKSQAFVPAEGDANEATLSSDSQSEFQYRYPVEGDLCADVEILNYGHIYVKLFREDAPYAVENFTRKAKKGEYNGSLVSDAVKDYYLQCGKPMEAEKKEESIWGGGFSNEISDRLFPTRGSLCMANQGVDGTNAMQFFFVANAPETIRQLEEPLKERYGIGLNEYLEKYYSVKMDRKDLVRYFNYGGAPWLYGHNTVFGQIFKGYDVMDAVIAAMTDTENGVYIKKISIYNYI